MFMENLKIKIVSLLRWSEKYTKTDMVYLTKNSFWINANTIIVSIFSFVLSIAFARFVSKDTYGIYQFVISLSGIIGAFTLTGMNTAVTQAVARGFEGVFQKSVRTQIKFAFIPLLIGLAISLYYALNLNSTLSTSLIIVAIFLPLSNALNTWGAFLNGKKEFGNYFKLNQITNFIYYGGMITSIILLPNVILLIALNFLLGIVSNLVIYKLVVKKYKPNQNQDNENIHFGKKLSLSNILPIIALSIDNIIIFHYLGATNLAIYAFASNIPERLGGLMRPISMIAFPKFSEQDPEILKENIYKKTLKFFILAIIAGIIYIFISPYFFKLLFPLYTDSVFYSQLYTIAVIISLTATLPLTSIYARKLSRIYILNIIYPLASIILLVLGGYFGGLIGVIYAKIASSILLLGGTLYLNKY